MAITYPRVETSIRGGDLRSHLAALESAGHLRRVREPLALDQEIGALCLISLREQGPALLFERPGGSDIPLVVDVLGSRLRYAMALGVQPEELAHTWNQRLERLLPPV